MKKLLIASILIAGFSCMSIKAQFSFGLKGGVNFATIANYDVMDIPESIENAVAKGDNSYRVGYNAGIFLNYAVAEGVVAFQPELLYSNQGMAYKGTIFGIDGTSIESTIKTDYITIPLMVQLYIIPKVLYAEAGPQLGFMVNSRNDSKYTMGGVSYERSWDLKDEMNTFDFSLALGVGFQIPGLPLGVNARYTLGFTDVNNEAENDRNYNSVFQLGAFVKFGNSE